MVSLFFFISMISMNMDGYGNDFKLFYNTDLTAIKFNITISCLYDELKLKKKYMYFQAQKLT